MCLPNDRDLDTWYDVYALSFAPNDLLHHHLWNRGSNDLNAEATRGVAHFEPVQPAG